MREKNQAKDKLWSRDFLFLALIQFSLFFGFQAMVTGIPLYVSMLHASDVVVGLTLTLSTLTALLVRPITGFMLDVLGRKGILFSSTLVTVFIIAAYAIFPIIGVILVLRFVHGITWGFSSTATSTMAADIVPKSRFAEGIGTIALFSSLSIAIAPAFAIALIEAGHPMLMFAFSVGATVVAAVLALFVRAKRPEDLRAEAAERIAAERGIDPSEVDVPKPRLTIKGIFEREAMFPGVVQIFINFAFATISAFLAIYGQELGVANISLYFVAYAVTCMVTRPLIGRIIDRSGYFVPGIAAILGVIATMLLIAFSTNLLMFCVAGLFAGLGFGTAMGVFQSMAVASVSPQRRGVATSTYFLWFDGGVALGAVVGGFISTAVGYGMMYAIMAGFPAIALLIYLIFGPKYLRKHTR
ncbi:MAG: MFS transporter [bacterium]|nr:MFS transporter [bacterium]